MNTTRGTGFEPTTTWFVESERNKRNLINTARGNKRNLVNTTRVNRQNFQSYHCFK